MKLASDVILNIAEIEKNAYQLVSKGLNEIQINYKSICKAI